MFTLNCKGRILDINDPVVMGIINTTPDSFFSGSRINDVESILSTAEKMIMDGATILDIGGQSTRPGSSRIDEDEELKRVLPAIEAIHSKFPDQIISIDTFYVNVAKQAVHAGASIVNDVSAGKFDSEMFSTVADMQVPYVLMHMPDEPQTMQVNPTYKNIVADVFDFLNFKMNEIVKKGINDIIIDPGFGFGKTALHNFQLLKQLSWFHQLNKPIMVGLSRKATVYRTLKIEPDEALNGTTVLHSIALMNGADILRVHDVKEAVQAVKLYSAYSKAKEQISTAP
ncbi:MAG: dihydropteroate synthase [Flavisolibacter sp.]